MRIHILCACLVCGALVGDSSNIEAQACRPADATSESMIGGLTNLMTDSYPQFTQVRDSLRLPLVSGSSIVLVTNDSICTQLAKVYGTAISEFGMTPSGKVYAVKVGSVYVVYDPAIHAGEYQVHMVITEQGVILSRSTG